MADIKFYTKSQCKNAHKQIDLLKMAGHTVNVIDLLEYEWNEFKLRYYFGNLPAPEWFNMKHPKIAQGYVDPKKLNVQEAIALLIEDHLYIRRPILEVGMDFQIGFHTEAIDKWIGLKPENEADANRFNQDVTTCNEIKCDD